LPDATFSLAGRGYSSPLCFIERDIGSIMDITFKFVILLGIMEVGFGLISTYRGYTSYQWLDAMNVAA
jgi:hypothetical protein